MFTRTCARAASEAAVSARRRRGTHATNNDTVTVPWRLWVAIFPGPRFLATVALGRLHLVFILHMSYHSSVMRM